MYLYVYNSTITNVRKEVFIMGKEEYYDRGKYADMLTGNLDKICEIASKTTNGTTGTMCNGRTVRRQYQKSKSSARRS